MKTSQNGINLIKQFEGCRLQAYKPVAAEPCYTIGYGHYGSDVLPGMIISQAQAEALLVQDLAKYENAVNATGLSLNQNQFDALVSFAYNCGAGNLKKLVRGRTPQQIPDAMLAYNKGSGKVLAGLTRRRQAERQLFLSGGAETPKTGNPYAEPAKIVKLSSKGNDARWLQYQLNTFGYRLIVDGIIGQKSHEALIDFQFKHGLAPDGICGEKTKAALLH
ncbi:MAG: glycoside hydrolase family protein [Lachnospiraceae bacterium]|nr:glycoside hydrolase family protein [Lachnospiraceae bacterium]